MKYREDLIQLLQDWVNENGFPIYLSGYYNGLPEMIGMDFDTSILYVNTIQVKYLEYLQNLLGEDAIYYPTPYAVEFDCFALPNPDLKIRKEIN